MVKSFHTSLAEGAPWAASLRAVEMALELSKAAMDMVMTNIANWKDPPFLMGKSTISTGSFSIATLNYQRLWICSVPKK